MVKNGKIVNVYSGEIYDGGVWRFPADRSRRWGDVAYTVGPDTRIIDAGGTILRPDLLTGISIGELKLSILAFAEIMLKHGTTVIMTDLHEVGRGRRTGSH